AGRRQLRVGLEADHDFIAANEGAHDGTLSLETLTAAPPWSGEMISCSVTTPARASARAASCAPASASRARAAYAGASSTPIALRPSASAAASVVPEPANGSSTVSPGSVNSSMNQRGSACGNAALWPLLPHSVARCSTLVGYARSRPCQLAMFLPNALPTRESWRTTSFAPRVFSRVFAQS